MSKRVLVTGGAGYIGSHCCVELLKAGYEVVAIDNFANCVADANGKAPALLRVEEITGKKIDFHECDLLDTEKLLKVFSNCEKIHSVIHLAGLKAVGESMQRPFTYYKNNLVATVNLLDAMQKVGCHQFLFSSSCTVYGDPHILPISEEHPTGNVTNVYGRTKHFIEEMLKDLSKANPKWNIVSLRYFNPVGAHPSGLIGEDPTKEFYNIMPFISSVASGKKPYLTIFGSDYDTKDGTCVRDYIHVMDLARGHLAALDKLLNEHLSYEVYNLGTGTGISVRELVRIFEEVTGTHVPIREGERRLGDVATLFCSAQKANEVLHWFPQFSLTTMCQDFWRWQTMNPNGYKQECARVGNGICAHESNGNGWDKTNANAIRQSNDTNGVHELIGTINGGMNGNAVHNLYENNIRELNGKGLWSSNSNGILNL